MRGILLFGILLPLLTIVGALPAPEEAVPNPAPKEAVPAPATAPKEVDPQIGQSEWWSRVKEIARENWCTAQYAGCTIWCYRVCTSYLLLTFFANNL
jgi:hypothetical protein